jgi:hypothetical protein
MRDARNDVLSFFAADMGRIFCHWGSILESRVTANAS